MMGDFNRFVKAKDPSQQMYITNEVERIAQEKRRNEQCAKSFDWLRERMLAGSSTSAGVRKFEVKHREVISIEKRPLQSWHISEIGTLNGRAIADDASILRQELHAAAIAPYSSASNYEIDNQNMRELILQFVSSLKCETLHPDATAEELEAIISVFDEAGEIEITEAFDDADIPMYFSIKNILLSSVAKVIETQHSQLCAAFSIHQEMHVIANDTDVEQIFSIYLKPILRYKVHKRNWLEMETLVSYIFSVIPKEFFLIEFEEIVDPREHLPFITQIVEENNLTDVELVRRKEIKITWDDMNKRFDTSIEYSVEQKVGLPIQKVEAAQNAKASFEELLFELENAKNKNVQCFRALLANGLKTNIAPGSQFNPNKFNLVLTPVFKEYAPALRLSRPSDSSSQQRILQRNPDSSITGILLINHKQKLSIKALKDLKRIQQDAKFLSVAVIDVDLADQADFIQFIKANNYEKDAEFYTCDASVQRQIYGICAAELFPAMVLIDGSHTLVAKNQFYALDWRQLIMKFSDVKQLKGFSFSAISPNAPAAGSAGPAATHSNALYKCLKEKFLKDLRAKKLLDYCQKFLQKLAYPLHFELAITSLHSMDWEGTFKEKTYLQPRISYNVAAIDIATTIKPILDLLQIYVPLVHFHKRIPSLQLQRGNACEICKRTFRRAAGSATTLLEGKIEENMYLSPVEQLYYCEDCYGSYANRRIFKKPTIFIHADSTLIDLHVDQIGKQCLLQVESNAGHNENATEEQKTLLSSENEECHWNVPCAGCQANNIVGRRWICLSCDAGRTSYVNSMLVDRNRNSENNLHRVSLCDTCWNLLKDHAPQVASQQQQQQQQQQQGVGVTHHVPSMKPLQLQQQQMQQFLQDEKNMEILRNIAAHSHAYHHITLGVAFYNGVNII